MSHYNIEENFELEIVYKPKEDYIEFYVWIMQFIKIFT